MPFKMMAIVAATFIAVPAIAQDMPAAPVKEKKICRSEQVTGSIMGKHVCHTKSEWADIDQANARAADDMMARTRSNNGGQSR